MRAVLILVLAFFIITSLLVELSAQTEVSLERGINYYHQKKYAAANKQFVKILQDRDPNTYPQALYYLEKYKVEVLKQTNLNEEQRNNFASIFQGFTAIQNKYKNNSNFLDNFASLYHYGWGVSKNLERAAKLYFKSFQLGNQTALLSLYQVLNQLTTFDKETREIKKFIKLLNSAERGDANAIKYLVDKYLVGDAVLGVPKSHPTALKYLNRLTEKSAFVYYRKGVIYANNEGVPQNYNLAFEWFQKGVGVRDSASMYNLGVFYEFGLGVEQDYEKAREWYLEAARYNYVLAIYKIGLFFLEGKSVLRDHVIAEKWLGKALKLGYGLAACKLAQMYVSNQEYPVDFTKAKKFAKLGFNLATDAETKSTCQQTYNEFKLYLY